MRLRLPNPKAILDRWIVAHIAAGRTRAERAKRLDEFAWWLTHAAVSTGIGLFGLIVLVIWATR